MNCVDCKVQEIAPHLSMHCDECFNKRFYECNEDCKQYKHDILCNKYDPPATDCCPNGCSKDDIEGE